MDGRDARARPGGTAGGLMANRLIRLAPIGGPITGYSEFEMDVEGVLREQLPKFFEETALAPLTRECVDMLPERAKGAYMLFHRGVPVYAGKTDARHGFRDRLARHWYTLQHRQNLRIGDIGFKAVRVMVFSNFDVERILIDEIRRQNVEYLAWNDSGFGSNDPGRNREGQEPADFDEDFPIDIGKPLDVIPAGRQNLLHLLVKVKDELPYLFRYETDIKGRKGNKIKYVRHTVGHAEQRAAMIEIPAGPITMRDFLTIVVNALPNWQATVLPGRIILYRERANYQFAKEYIR